MSESVTLNVTRGRSTPLVPFLFGVAQRAELPGTALNRLLGDLGLTPAAARALVARMRRDGNLASVRRGRGVDYRLAGELARGFERIRQGASGPVEWTGSFHALLYQVPEDQRAFRDALRRAAVLSGYGILQQGVLIALTDRSAHLAPLAARPDTAQVYLGRLHLTDGEAARAAYSAWSLGELNRRYVGHTEILRRAVRWAVRPPAATPQTLRRYTELLNGPLVDTLRGPRLPAALLPADWALPELRAVIADLQRVYGPPSITHVERVIAAS